MRRLLIDIEKLAELCKNDLSMEAVGRSFGVSGQTINRRIQELGLDKKGVNTYKNKDWLYNQYVNLVKTKQEIADDINIGITTINRWMKKHEIPIRDRGLASHLALGNTIHIEQELAELLNGGAIGDGYIGSNSTFSAYYTQTNKHEDFIQWLSVQFHNLGVNGSIHKNVQERWGKERTSYTFCSRNYSDFLAFQKMWYPNGKKIVPQDLELTPSLLLFWYLGDGYLSSSENVRPIILCTNGFSDKDVELLVRKLADLEIYSRRQPSRNTIYINSTVALDFLKIIGECPKEIWSCCGYKWDLGRLKYEWEAEFCPTVK